MGKRGRRPVEPAVQDDHLVKSTGEPLEMAAVEPRTVAALGHDARELVRELQAATIAARRAQEEQRRLVGLLRRYRAPWSALGWALGTTGEAARQRFGDTPRK